MLVGSFRRSPHRRVLTLRLLDHFTDDGCKLEQLQLRLREFFSACSIFRDSHQPQSLLQHPNLQFRVLQLALQLCDEYQIGWQNSLRRIPLLTNSATNC